MNGHEKVRKTPFCKYFLSGKCIRGDLCTLVHSEEEKNNAIARITKRQEQIEAISESHLKDRLRPDENFEHENSDNSSKSPPRRRFRAIKEMHEHHNEGSSKSAVKIRQVDLFKSHTLCKNFLEGYCKFGSKCIFNHSEEERKKAMNKLRRENREKLEEQKRMEVFDPATMRRIFALRAATKCDDSRVKHWLEKLGCEETGMPKNPAALYSFMSNKYEMGDRVLANKIWDAIAYEASKMPFKISPDTKGRIIEILEFANRNSDVNVYKTAESNAKAMEQKLRSEIQLEYENKWAIREKALSEAFKNQLLQIRTQYHKDIYKLSEQTGASIKGQPMVIPTEKLQTTFSQSTKYSIGETNPEKSQSIELLNPTAHEEPHGNFKRKSASDFFDDESESSKKKRRDGNNNSKLPPIVHVVHF